MELITLHYSCIVPLFLHTGAKKLCVLAGFIDWWIPIINQIFCRLYEVIVERENKVADGGPVHFCIRHHSMFSTSQLVITDNLVQKQTTKEGKVVRDSGSVVA